jgi:cysteinyl-tRNA synthetase
MAVKLFNYLGRKIDDFSPLSPNQVEMYTCGPTVYDFVHLGNWRTFIFEDLLKRVLTYSGYQVKQVMNITDIDDKIIKRAAAENTNLKSLTTRYTEIFFQDRDQLNILPAEAYPKATDHVPQMISLIEKLIEKNLAYESEGSVYYSIKKFPTYGQLSNTDITNYSAEKTDKDNYLKDSASDFVLWKAAKKDEPTWDSPWGPGRPGWHIECSAMSMKELGETFDIHAVGLISSSLITRMRLLRVKAPRGKNLLVIGWRAST